VLVRAGNNFSLLTLGKHCIYPKSSVLSTIMKNFGSPTLFNPVIKQARSLLLSTVEKTVISFHLNEVLYGEDLKLSKSFCTVVPLVHLDIHTQVSLHFHPLQSYLLQLGQPKNI